MQGRNVLAAFMERLCEGSTGNRPGRASVMIVAAHPDDEVIGMGASMARLGGCMVMHVTDGAPRDMRDATAYGFDTREAYAKARRKELKNALALAGIGPERCLELGGVDQEASFELFELTRRLAELLYEFRPTTILTHPYEGGHPDHDATAFITHKARLMLQKKWALKPPALIEFASYHQSNAGGMAVYEFLPRRGYNAVTVYLTEKEKELKQRMIDCYVTQQTVLLAFPVAVERFRSAPGYDFTKPPHTGSLFYESYTWGITGKLWRCLAGEAQTRLRADGCL